MRMFLSFAGEQSRVAESIYRKLLAAGYDPFFASDEIRASDGYDARIREAIEQNDHMLFLASEASLAKGCYTLTELKLFSKRFPDPTGRVMVVMLDSVSYAKLPPYLGAVTSALSPQGNVASEVTAEVIGRWPLDGAEPSEEEVQASAQTRRRLLMVAGAVVILALLALLLLKDGGATIPATVVGEDIPKAREILIAAGFEPGDAPDAGFDEQKPMHEVLGTDPAVGSHAASGAKVRLLTNQFRLVPTGLIGKLLADARIALLEARFLPDLEVVPGFDRGWPEGAVIACSAEAGQRCPVDTRLVLTVNDVSKMSILGTWKLKPGGTYEHHPFRMEVTLEPVDGKNPKVPGGRQVHVKFWRRTTSNVPAILTEATLAPAKVWRHRFEDTRVRFMDTKGKGRREDLQERKVGWFVEPGMALDEVRVTYTDGLHPAISLLVREK